MESSGERVKPHIAGPHHRVSGSVSLGRDLRICISDKFPAVDDAVLD